MIYVESVKKSLKSIRKKHPTAEIIDVTSKGEVPWIYLSPFYPHGKIPVPYSPGFFSNSVEGIWQGLKVFEFTDIDKSKFEIGDMKGIKRTVRTFGRPLGHRKGLNGVDLLDYVSARKKIYLPSYLWVLENIVLDTIELLKEKALRKDIILLDFGTNGDVENTKKPLSHAAIVKQFLEDKYPELLNVKFDKPPHKPGA